MKTYRSFSQGIATIVVIRSSQPQNCLCFGLGFKLSDLVTFINNQMKDLRKSQNFILMWVPRIKQPYGNQV